MSSLRIRRTLLALLAAASLLALSALPALAGGGYSLRVKLSKSDRGRALDISLPWDLSHGSSPFDFASDDGDGPGVARLREAWSTLSRMPERKPIIITGEHKQVRAWRDRGALVLEPLDDVDDHDTRVRIPAEIVEAMLRHDGRLMNNDLADLLRGRHEISLVDVRSNDGQVQVWIDRDEDDLER